MDVKRRVLLLGGPGNISTSTLRKLVDLGVPVGLYTTHTVLDEAFAGKVTHLVGNREDAEGVTNAVEAFRPDAVIDTICFKTEQAQAAVDACAGKIDQLLFISTVDVYGYPLSKIPMKESDPWVPTITDYAEQKRLCEIILRDAEADGAFSLTVARPAYSIGKTFLAHFTDYSAINYIKRVLAGRPVIMPGEGQLLFHASVAANAGHMWAHMALTEACRGKQYTCAHNHVLTQIEYLRMIAKVVGVEEPDLRAIPVKDIMRLGGEALAHCPLEIHFKEPMAFDISAFRRDCPEFLWEYSIEDGMRHFLGNRDMEAELAKAPERIIDDTVIERWDAENR